MLTLITSVCTYQSPISARTYIFSQEVCFVIGIDENARIATLVSKRLLATQICVLTAHRIASRNANFSLFVVTTVNMHPHYILLGGLVVDDLWAFDDTIRPSIARCGLGKQCALVTPFYKVGRRIAVHVDEGCTVGLVLANPEEIDQLLLTPVVISFGIPVPLVADFEYATAMRLDVLACICLLDASAKCI